MRKILLFLLIISKFSIAIPLFCLSGNRNDDEIKTKIDEYMTRVEKNGFSGSLLVAKDGKIILSKGYGLADRERNIPVTNQTVFTVGSITKQFTGAAILKLQMMGVLNVNDPISKYFKNVPEDKKSITLHHLLTHTAGFPGAIGGDFQPINRDDFIELAMNTKLNSNPGKKYEYSNVGFSLLGTIIEIATGESYEAFLHEKLFKPAGMMNTGYRIPKWNQDELAHGYRREKDWGTLIDKSWAEDGPYWHLRANGGILSTVEDMFQWHLALKTDRILTKEAKRAYYSPHVREGEDADSYYGYGWAIFMTPRNTRLIAHNGGNTIFSADFLRYIDEDVVIIVLANTAGQHAWNVSNAVAKIVFGYDYKLPPEKTEQLTIEELKKTKMGARALTLLQIYRTSDEGKILNFIKENFETDYIERATEEGLLRFIQQDQKGIGDAKIGQVVKNDEHTLELTVQSKNTGEWWLISIEFEGKDPYKIINIGVVDTQPPIDADQENDNEDLSIKWGLPSSNTGRRSAALLEAINRMDDAYSRKFIKTNFAPEFLNQFPLEKHLDQFHKMHQDVGKLELLGAMKTGMNSARIKVRSIESGKVFKIQIELEEHEPYRIVGISVASDE